MTAAVPEPPHLVTDLKTLCLPTMTAEWRPLAAQATRERQPPAEHLAQLVHLEVTGRRERRIQRRLQEARFPMLKTLDAFQFDAQPELDRDAILQLCGGAFVAEAANVVLVGGVGTDKTHLAMARQWARRLRPSMRQVHRAGVKTFIDFSGKRPSLVDRRTGELRRVELFVAVLGASSLTYQPVEEVCSPSWPVQAAWR